MTTCINITLNCNKCSSYVHTYLTYKEVEQEKLIPNTQKCYFCNNEIDITKKNIVSVDIDLDYHIWITEELKKESPEKFIKYRDYLIGKGLIVNRLNDDDLRKNKMEYEVNEVVIIPQGEHTGKIRANERREQEYKGKVIVYHEYFILMDDVKDKDGKPIELKLGFPANITNESGHGKFLKSMGLKLLVGKKINTDEVNGKRIKFLTMNKKTEKGVFAEIVKESIEVI